jgi:RNA polymerase sigma factor (sigma-70 family)
MQRLSHGYQQVIQLRHRENLSFEEVALRLGLSPAAARKLWARAIKRLRKEIVVGRT